MIAAIYARKSTDQHLPRRREVSHPPGGTRDGVRRPQHLFSPGPHVPLAGERPLNRLRLRVAARGRARQQPQDPVAGSRYGRRPKVHGERIARGG